MKIEKYRFGIIIIDGRTYTKDLIILPDRIVENWRRREGHRLDMQDLEALWQSPPHTLVIGTGAFGFIKPAPGLINAIEARGIKVIMSKSADACEIFNKLSSDGDVALAIHLTC